MLLPVTINTNTSGQVLSINNDMSVTSTRLVGGPKGEPLTIQVIYSSYD